MLTGPCFIPEQTEKAFIFLHGYGSNGEDLFSLAPFLKRKFPTMAFFCPDGAQQGPFGGRQWFDLSYYPAVVVEEEDFLNSFFARMLPDGLKTAEFVKQYVQEIAQQCRLPIDKIVLGGFSQGGLMALLSGLTMTEKLAGIVGMSACAVVEKEGVFSKKEVVSFPEVSLIHGTADPVVPFMSTDLSMRFLKQAGVVSTLNVVSGLGHGIDDKAFDFLVNRLEKFL